MEGKSLKTFLLAAGIFLLNAALNRPLFLPGEMVYRGTIEAGYASMGRFFAEHPNPWGWNPTQYCGLPAQFTYVPAIPYLTAALIRLLPGWDPGHLYRILVSALACLGPVTLFLFALYFTKSRWWALAAALGYTFMSPSYAWIEQVDKDRGFAPLPWRILVLAKYGEGPHTAGLALLPVALAATWAVGVGRKYWQILLAAILLAAVTLTNWVAALALAFCCLMMLVAATGSEGFRARRVLATAGLAYLLACFWLTPRFLKTVAFNWPADAFNYHVQWHQTLLLAGLVGGLVALRLVFGRAGKAPYLCFLTLILFGFAYIVLIYYWLGLATIPESRRYSLELELFLFPLLVEFLRLAMGAQKHSVRYTALGLAGFLLWSTGESEPFDYARTSSQRWRPIPKEQTIEYQMAKWIAHRRPTGRVFAFGGVCFRLNSWYDIQQVGGTFESGLRNRIPVHFSYQARLGSGAPQQAVWQLKAMGVEYVVVNGPKSREYYHDFRDFGKFEGLAERVFREEDDVIYRLPFTSLAHLVRAEELPAEPPLADKVRLLEPYAAAIEDPARPQLRTEWRGSSELRIEGPVPEGLSVSVQVSHDWGWTAVQDGAPIRIDRDPMGFLLLRARPAPLAHIELVYHGGTDQRVMAGISAAAWIAALAGLWLKRNR